MEITRAATPATDSEFAGQLRFCACRECSALFVTHMHPFDRAVPSECVGEPIERITDHAEDPLHTGLDERADHVFRGTGTHNLPPRSRRYLHPGQRQTTSHPESRRDATRLTGLLEHCYPDALLAALHAVQLGH